MRAFKFGIVLGLFITAFALGAETNLKIIFFTEPGCPECERMDAFLQRKVVDFYPVDLVVKDVRVPENAAMLIELAELYGDQSILDDGTPALFVAGVSVQGDDERARMQIEEAVRANIFMDVRSPLDILAEKGSEKSAVTRVRLPAIFGAALVDAVNPCAFAVLTLLLGSLLAASRRKRVRRLVGAGLAFTLAVFICYTLIGFGILEAIHLSGLKSAVYTLAAFVAFVVGIWNLKDALRPNILPNIEVPKRWRGSIEKIVAGVGSAPGAFVAGALVSWLLLPCTSGPYLVALGMLSDAASRTEAVVLILLYNTVFVLPFLLITTLLAFGFARPYQIERWRQTHKRGLHLTTALVMIALGLVLVWLLLV